MARSERNEVPAIAAALLTLSAGVIGYGIGHAEGSASKKDTKTPIRAPIPVFEEPKLTEAQKIGIDNIVGPAASHFGRSTFATFPDFEKRSNTPYDKNKLNIISAGKTLNFDGRNDLIKILAIDPRIPTHGSAYTTTYEIEAKISSKDPTHVEFFEIKKFEGLIDFDSDGRPTIGEDGDIVQDGLQIQRTKLQLNLDGHWSIFKQNRIMDSESDVELSTIEDINKELELANARLLEMGTLG